MLGKVMPFPYQKWITKGVKQKEREGDDDRFYILYIINKIFLLISLISKKIIYILSNIPFWTILKRKV